MVMVISASVVIVPTKGSTTCGSDSIQDFKGHAMEGENSKDTQCKFKFTH